jgi:hypothetical protein
MPRTPKPDAELTPRERRRRQRMAADPSAAARRAGQRGSPKGRRKRTDAPKPLSIHPIDGEAFEWDAPSGHAESRYGLLQCLDAEPLWGRRGLSTEAVLTYLCHLPPSWALAGFGLQYDFENWLRDVPDADYAALVNGETEDGILFRGFRIQMIPRKIFTVETTAGNLEGQNARSPETRIRRTVYDMQGYYQTSLISALRKAGITVQAEIEAGKAARGGFRWEQRSSVAAYNLAELKAMMSLFGGTARQVNAGLERAGMRMRLGARDLYGPGALARKFLKEVEFPAEHPALAIPPEASAFLEAQHAAHWGGRRPWLARFPFSAAYFGGRIEAAAVGRFPRVYDYDLHSAYPAALSRLPAWRPGDLRWAEGLVAQGVADSDCVGMYFVEWSAPEGMRWGPLPYRSASGNVFFPLAGQSWVMSPELAAARDTGIPCRVTAALYLEGTAGAGPGTAPVASRSAEAISRAYAFRQQLIAEGSDGEKAFKLILNSVSGKLWQQVGVDPSKDIGLFCDLAGAWITSWTRAMVWRAAAAHAGGTEIVAIQTDGLCSTVPLDLDQGPGLGQWECEELEDYRQFLPGIYDHADGAGGRTGKTRGFSKRFEHERAWDVVRGQIPSYDYRFRYFVGRRHALAQPGARCWYPGSDEETTQGQSRLQWRETAKRFTVTLGSKRTEPDLPGARRFALEGLTEGLARHLWREEEAPWRELYGRIMAATGRAGIRPHPGADPDEIPLPLRRHRSMHTPDGVAQLLGMEEDELMRQLRDAWWRRQRRSMEAALRGADAQLAPAIRQALEEAAALEAQAAEQACWTEPKPNRGWLRQARPSMPFELRFSATPYAADDALAGDRRVEDAEGEDGGYVAGIRE